MVVQAGIWKSLEMEVQTKETVILQLKESQWETFCLAMDWEGIRGSGTSDQHLEIMSDMSNRGQLQYQDPPTTFISIMLKSLPRVESRRLCIPRQP